MRRLHSRSAADERELVRTKPAAASPKTIPLSIASNKRSAAGSTGQDGNGTAGKTRRSGAKRGAILRGAKRVFLSHGFEGASMDEVAARAGVSKMTVYRHFGNKEDLFAGVITDLCNCIVSEDLERIFELAPEQALRGYAERMIEIVFDPETIELHRIVVAESRRFPSLGQFFYDCGPQVCIDVLARYFERNRTDARFRIADPVRSAEEFLELLRGYAHLRVMLKVERAPAPSEMAERIQTAVGHVLRL
jgi:TetR/AcrR family transcriptional repressor of mexJK operon